MPIAIIAHTAACGSTTATVTTSGIDTTGADKIVVAISQYDTRGAVLIDSYGNTWTAIAARSEFSGDSSIQFYYCNAPTVGTGHTFTLAASACYPSLAVIAFSGADTLSAVDQSSGSTTNTGTSITSGTITPTTNGQIVIAAATMSGSKTATATNLTLADAAPGGTTYSVALSYQIQGTAAAASEIFDWLGQGTSNAAIVIASFGGASAGGGGGSWTFIG